MLSGRYNLPGKRHIGNHDDICQFGPLDLDFKVRILRIRGEAVAGFRQRFYVLFKRLSGMPRDSNNTIFTGITPIIA